MLSFNSLHAYKPNVMHIYVRLGSGSQSQLTKKEAQMEREARVQDWSSWHYHWLYLEQGKSDGPQEVEVECGSAFILCFLFCLFVSFLNCSCSSKVRMIEWIYWCGFLPYWAGWWVQSLNLLTSEKSAWSSFKIILGRIKIRYKL